MTYDPRTAETGRRVRISALGETPLDAIENHLLIEDQPPPDPAELKPTDVIIRVESAAVGWVDLIMTSGQYQHVPAPPYTPGLEYSGVVVWSGSEVDGDRAPVGARVMADGFLTGPRSKGGYQKHGGFATYTVAPAEAARPLPTGFSFDQACNFLGNYETAYHCLIARGRLRAGETVLILGATGSTGLAAVHVAKRAGATVIAVGRSAEKLEQVRSQGADHVICTAREDGEPGLRRFRREVKELTGGTGVDLVYDAVGGEVSLEALRCVRFGARFSIVGWAATPFVAKGRGERGAPNANQLPTNLIMMKGLDVLGCPTVIATHNDPAIREQRLGQLLAWVEAGELAPHVARAYPLAEIKEAMLAKWESRYVGGIVVHP